MNPSRQGTWEWRQWERGWGALLLGLGLWAAGEPCWADGPGARGGLSFGITELIFFIAALILGIGILLPAALFGALAGAVLATLMNVLGAIFGGPRNPGRMRLVLCILGGLVATWLARQGFWPFENDASHAPGGLTEGMMPFLAPVVGIGVGLCVGLITNAVGRLFRRKKPEATVTPPPVEKRH